MISYLPENLPENVYLNFIKINPFIIKYIKNPSYNLCKIAIENNFKVLEYIENQTKELCSIALKQNIQVFKLKMFLLLYGWSI